MDSSPTTSNKRKLPPISNNDISHQNNTSNKSTENTISDRIKRRRQEFNGCEIRIPKDCDIDETKLEPFKEFYPILATEFKNLNIQTIINRYEPILDEFYEFSEPYRLSSPKYNAILDKTIQRLIEIYKIKRSIIYINRNAYTTSAWGNLYWTFYHMTSILISHAYCNGTINDYLDFPLIVYNIDCILPCIACKYHYIQAKQSQNIKNSIKTISFGLAMTGLMEFHNIITSNIDQLPENSKYRQRERFIMPDFALEYNCIELYDTPMLKSLTYIPKDVDWQSETHTYLTILLAVYCPQLYAQASCLLKQTVYTEEKSFDHINLLSKKYNFNIYTKTDLLIANMTKKQIVYCLVQAILLQLQDTLITENEIEQNRFFNASIAALYRKYPNIIRKLIDLNLPSSSKTSKTSTVTTTAATTSNIVSETTMVMDKYPSREFILATLDKINQPQSEPMKNVLNN